MKTPLICAGFQHGLATVFDAREDVVIPPSIYLTNENARRIVACVNACANISTETLEINFPHGELKPSVKTSIARIRTARKYNAKFQAAIDAALESWVEGDGA